MAGEIQVGPFEMIGLMTAVDIKPTIKFGNAAGVGVSVVVEILDSQPQAKVELKEHAGTTTAIVMMNARKMVMISLLHFP